MTVGEHGNLTSLPWQPRGGGAAPNPAAPGKLVDRYLPLIYAFVSSRLDDRAAAEALTARTLERGFEAIADGELDVAEIGGFLYRVAATAVVDHVRRGRRTIAPGVRASDSAGSSDRELAEALAGEEATRALAASIDSHRLRRAFVRLPDAQRRIIVLRYFDGLDADEMCAVLACSMATLAIEVGDALRALREHLLEQAIDAA
jgi:RNA polymerase sigma factor (sigma-70 family)